MTYRIVIPCNEEHPERRHRWHWELAYGTVDDPVNEQVWDQRCVHCYRWFVDVIEHKS
jgi:hypothetical protein